MSAWTWGFGAPLRGGDSVTIVALGITGEETAADLQRLAEVFEVREALMREDEDYAHLPLTATLAAERLHAAGWRPGMTAEDAARLLAGAGK